MGNLIKDKPTKKSSWSSDHLAKHAGPKPRKAGSPSPHFPSTIKTLASADGHTKRNIRPTLGHRKQKTNKTYAMRTKQKPKKTRQSNKRQDNTRQKKTRKSKQKQGQRQ